MDCFARFLIYISISFHDESFRLKQRLILINSILFVSFRTEGGKIKFRLQIKIKILRKEMRLMRQAALNVFTFHFWTKGNAFCHRYFSLTQAKQLIVVGSITL